MTERDAKRFFRRDRATNRRQAGARLTTCDGNGVVMRPEALWDPASATS
jgi:hypothetical protein